MIFFFKLFLLEFFSEITNKNILWNDEIDFIFLFEQNGLDLGGNAQQTGNVLRILNTRPENSGVYSCMASNNVGSDQKATVIDVERKYLIFLCKN